VRRERAPRTSRRGRIAVAAVLLAAGCSQGLDAPAPEEVLRLERFFLARLDPPLASWMFCDRFELTRGEYFASPEAADADLPAVFLTYCEFDDWTGARGLRAPTTAEWRALAGLPEASSGPTPLGRNTLELALGRPLAVGVFERGRSPLGGYDFYGNVREMAGPMVQGRVLAMGGSFATHAVGYDARDVVAVDIRDRADDLGARCVTDALPYLRERVQPLWRSHRKAVEPSLRAAAARWRPDLRQGLAAHLLAAGLDRDFVAAIAP